MILEWNSDIQYKSNSDIMMIMKCIRGNANLLVIASLITEKDFHFQNLPIGIVQLVSTGGSLGVLVTVV